jgi:hypothetical protein
VELNLAEEAGLQIFNRFGPAPFLGWREAAHQREHLCMMVVNVGERHASLASAFDRTAAVQIWIEARMARTFATPANAADLEHSCYFTDAAPGAGMAGADARGTTPFIASSIETLCAASVEPIVRSNCTFDLA